MTCRMCAIAARATTTACMPVHRYIVSSAHSISATSGDTSFLCPHMSMHICMHACMHTHTHTCAICRSYTKLKHLFVVLQLLLQYPQLVCCCRALLTMSDDEHSTTRQWSDASSEEAEEQITCRFTNPLTGGTYFTKPMKFMDKSMSIGFLFHIVKSEFGNSEFKLQVGKQVWQSGGLDVYGKFWLFQSVQDALGASEAHEIIVDVIKVACTPESE